MRHRDEKALADETRADWPFLQNGAVTLFWRKAILHEARDTLATLHYEISTIPCDSDATFFAGLSDTTRWLEQFGYGPWGGNLDALNDGLGSMPFPPSGRKALCFEDFDKRVADNRARALATLDVIECQSRRHLLRGCILVALVQTKSARFATGPLGGRDARWNDREWLSKRRGL